MNARQIVPLILIGSTAALNACGGAATDEFEARAPSYEQASMELTDADAVEPTEAPALTTDAQDLGDDACHPHLFTRTHEIVRAVNGGVFKLSKPVRELLHGGGRKLGTGDSRSWDRIKDGIETRFTMTRTGTHSFSALLEMKKVADANFSTIYSATVQGADAPPDGSGSITLDLTALHAIDPNETASGKLAVSFSVAGDQKTVIATLTDYLLFPNDPHGVRNGKYVFFREHGKGGSLKFHDDLTLLCTGNGQTAGTSPIWTVTRWVRQASGSVHFRADTQAVGGQIAAGNKWEGVTCAQTAATSGTESEGFWMMKLEAAGGATISGSAHQTADSSGACDAVFGDVPLIGDATKDFDFTAVDFTTDAPYPFPGM